MRDLRQAWRSLRATPVLSAIIAASLAIGIGANTVVFSWLQMVRWKPLPAVAHASSFYTIEPRTADGVYLGSSWLDYRDLHARLTSFEWLEAFRMTPLTVGEAPNVSRAAGLFVSGGYFRSLGLKPTAGRLLEETTCASLRAACSSSPDDYWRSHFAGSPSAWQLLPRQHRRLHRRSASRLVSGTTLGWRLISGCRRPWRRRWLRIAGAGRPIAARLYPRPAAPVLRGRTRAIRCRDARALAGVMRHPPARRSAQYRHHQPPRGPQRMMVTALVFIGS